MPPSLHLKRILVADDYPDAASSLATLLELAQPGATEVTCACDGARAVEVALSKHLDMAILDIEMPVLDGVQAAVAIRTALGANAPLLVVLTGNRRRAFEPKTREAFDHTMCKPADVDQLLRWLLTVDE